MVLQAVSRTGSQPGWREAHAAGIGSELDSTRASAWPGPAPERDPELDAAAPSAQPPQTDRTDADTSVQSGNTAAREGLRGAKGVQRDLTERDLLFSLLEGDNGAWQEFERRYTRLIRSCIRRATAQFPAIGPDDTQEIEAMLWVQLLANDRRKLRGFQPERGCALSTWIGMLAIHCAYDYLRALRREPVRVALADAERLSSALPDPADLCAAREHAARLEAALECFSARDREFVRLYFGEGLEAEQVAGQMGISVKTVYSKKHKIRLRLESVMAQERLAA
ncbi:MAG: sigma-70 family RNA polymerase sigma factor [Polyangiaceae bacterium]|nr:sigma-70 family RNA polymerase sigma factor [Polyangiaceae bacterium]